jgi:hypothetical protein
MTDTRKGNGPQTLVATPAPAYLPSCSTGSAPCLLRPRAHRPDPVRPPDPLSTARPGTPPDRDLSGDAPMSKGKSQNNREAKKPKKEKPKVLATANSNSDKNATVIAGKSVK